RRIIRSPPSRESRACRSGRPAAVLAGEEAARQWEVRNQAESELLERRNELGLDVTLQQRVLVLGRDERRPATRVCEAVGSAHLGGGEVRRADVTHLACFDELFERAEGLLDRRDAVGTVVLVEVDVVGAESLERAVDRAPDVRGGAAGRIAATPAEFRRDQDLLTAAGERPPEEELALPVTVRLRGVEERDADLE